MASETADDSFEHAAALQTARRFDEAIAIYERLAAKVLTVNIAINLAVCHATLGNWPRAEHYLGLASRHRPADGVIRRLLGNVHAEAGHTDLAEREYRAILAALPDDGEAQLALGGLCLSLGRYAEGWPLLGARAPLHPDVVPRLNLPYPEWRGEPLDGKSLLVWVEQGFGDQIQMSRFVNTAKAKGAARVTLGSRPQLAHLFSTLAGVDEIVPVAVKGSASVGPHDYWSRCFSLPEHLGITLETLPADPYLSAPADRRDRWAGGPGSTGGVGLVWRASPTGFNATNKGLPREVAQRLLDRGAISLQPEDTGAADFADTAAIIARLDLVISIDTAVAHLAGAMGKPCWTLLPFIQCDWRWLRNRGDSPWYPSMRLYRQAQPRDWSQTIDQVLRDL